MELGVAFLEQLEQLVLPVGGQECIFSRDYTSFSWASFNLVVSCVLVSVRQVVVAQLDTVAVVRLEIAAMVSSSKLSLFLTTLLAEEHLETAMVF